MSQATLSSGSYRNSNLFSGYYLDERVYGLDAWDCDAEAREAFEELSDLWAAESDLVESYNEDELLDSWINEVLSVMGFDTLSETTLPDGGGYTDRLLFDSASERRAAARERRDGKRGAAFERAGALLEAKRWNASFTDRFSEQRSYRDASHQVKYYLERTPESLGWAILTNGKKWRLYGTKDYETQTYYEVDLPELLESGSVEAFKYFYVFFRPAAFREVGGTTFLDTVWAESETAAQELGEDLQDNVFTALRVLGEGFVETNDLDIDPADDDRLAELKEQSLVLLYRLMFVLYAESRDLIDPDDPHRREEYEDNFSLDALRLDIRDEVGETPGESVFEREYSEFSTSMWGRLETLFSLIDTGNEDLGIPAYNGGLFDEGRHEFLAEHEVANTYIAEVIYRLSTTETDDGFVPADYADLDTRHLGTIYEGLLEHEFAIAPAEYAAVSEDGGEVWKPATEVSVAEAVETVETGELYVVNDDGERKATGAYYTPDYVVTYIVEETVGPLVGEIEADLRDSGLEPDDREYFRRFWRRVLDLRILDPAMGSGHFLTRATGYLTEQVMDVVREQEIQSYDEQDLRRHISKECIYGVDVNGMAVELAKLSMWLETLAADSPLAFLDHHLKTGNSLVGSDITEVLSDGDDDGGQLTLAEAFAGTRKRALDHVMDLTSELLAIDNEELDDIKEMETLYNEIRADPLYGHLRAMANVHTASEFGLDIPADADERLARAIEDEDAWAEIEGTDWFRAAQAMADDEDFFHWELEFPEVFFDMDGERMASAGFDVVIGNPPYGASFEKQYLKYLNDKYVTANIEYDSYTIFMEIPSILLNESGNFGYIVPSTWTRLPTDEPLREKLLTEFQIYDLLDCGRVFKSAIVETMMVSATKDGTETDTNIRIVDKNGTVEDRLDRLGSERFEFEYQIHQSIFYENKNKVIDYNSEISTRNLIGKIETQSIALNDFCDISQGVTAYDRHAGQDPEIIENRAYHSDTKENETYGKWLDGKDVRRYHFSWKGEWLNYGNWLSRPREQKYFSEPRLVFREVTGGINRVIAAYTDDEFYYGHSVIPAIITDDSIKNHSLLAIVNSTLLSYYNMNTSPNAQKGAFPKMNPDDVRALPIFSDITNSSENDLAERAKTLIGLKERRNSLNLDLPDYLGNYEDGPTLGELNYQPPSGLSSSVLADTEADSDFETLRVTAARVERDGGVVRVSAVPYVKPAVGAEYETNSRGYATLEPVPAMEFFDLSAAQAALIEAFVPYAVEEAGGFAGYRDNATATISPLDRLEGLTLPVLSDVEGGIERYAEAKERAAELDEKIEKTDELIDEIVYELYGLTDEEIEIVEEAVGE